MFLKIGKWLMSMFPVWRSWPQLLLSYRKELILRKVQCDIKHERGSCWERTKGFLFWKYTQLIAFIIQIYYLDTVHYTDSKKHILMHGVNPHRTHCTLLYSDCSADSTVCVCCFISTWHCGHSRQWLQQHCDWGLNTLGHVERRKRKKMKMSLWWILFFPGPYILQYMLLLLLHSVSIHVS